MGSVVPGQRGFLSDFHNVLVTVPITIGICGSPASGECSTGLATLRRDGFASMGAGGAEGFLLTRPLRFRSKHLFVHVEALPVSYG
jgi:hypothetical protein